MATPSAIGVLLLAAGGSARMGRPKQLLNYQGRSLLRRAAETALACSCGPVTAVLGCRAEDLRTELAGLALHAVVNPDWPAGMGSSLRRGLEAALAVAPDLAGVLVMTCDQPFVSACLLGQLIEIHRQTGKPLCAAQYGGTVGVPAFFGRPFFDDLKALSGGEGAKKILQANQEQLTLIPFPTASVDVDTPRDYEELVERE